MMTKRGLFSVGLLAVLTSGAAARERIVLDGDPVRAGDRLVFDLDAAALAGVRDHAALRIENVPLRDGERVALELERFEPLASDATLRVGSRPPEPLRLDAGTRFLRGRVAGRESVVFLTLRGESVDGFIRLADAAYVIGGAPSADGAVHSIRPLARAAATMVGDDECGGTPAPQVTEVVSPITTPRSGPLRATVAIEMRRQTYDRFTSLPAARDYVVNLVAATSAIYERDVGVELVLGFVQIYDSTEPSYYAIEPTLPPGEDLLAKFSAFWRKCFPVSRPAPTVPAAAVCAPHQPSTTAVFPRTLAVSLIDGGPAGSGAGLAYRDQLCAIGYAWAVVRPELGIAEVLGHGTFPHEIGHIFGSPHASCYEPRIDDCRDAQCYTGPQTVPPVVSLMSTCTNRSQPLAFHPAEAALIRERAEAAPCMPEVSTADVQAADDTYVSAAAQTTNYGGSTNAYAGRNQSQGKGGGPLLLRSLLHFNLASAVPPGAAISGATLWVYGQSGGGLPTLSVARLAASFTESTATWANQPAPSGVPAAAQQQHSPAAGWKTFDVTALAQDCRANRGDHCYWSMAEVNETDNTTSFLTFSAKEAAPETVPYVRVTYTP